MNKKLLQQQLDEIKDEGIMQVGYSLNIFNSPDIDWSYVIRAIIPDLLSDGMICENNASVAPHLILDEYMERLEGVDEFEPLAGYFYNYKGGQ